LARQNDIWKAESARENNFFNGMQGIFLGKTYPKKTGSCYLLIQFCF